MINTIDHPSPNFEDRPPGVAPAFIILHYTGMKTEGEALARLVDPAPGMRVSAHYLVAEDGRILRMVDESKTAWHAGKSYWAGIENLNAHSIGIEIVNPGHEWGYRPFPAAQMAAVADLCADIMARNNIRADRVLGHSDIAPGRKDDPGELFDWQFLAQRGIGVWPQAVADKSLSADTVRQALIDFGYDPRYELPVLARAFQRHFYPEAFAGLSPAETMTPQAAARLLALLERAPAIPSAAPRSR